MYMVRRLSVSFIAFITALSLVLSLPLSAAAQQNSTWTSFFTTTDTQGQQEQKTLQTKVEALNQEADQEANNSSSTVPVGDAASNKRLNAISLGTTKAAIKTSLTQAKSKKDWYIYLGKTLLQGVAITLLNKLTQATVNWINSGFEGKPQFVENPEQFFKSTGETYLKNIVDTIGYNSTKFPYGRAIARALIQNYVYSNKPIEDKLKFTLDKVVGDDWNNFQVNFKVGGWPAYEQYYNVPANNSFDFFFAALEAKHDVVTGVQQQLQSELDQGRGFLNQKVCVAERAGPQLDEAGTASEQVDANINGAGGDFDQAAWQNLDSYHNGSEYNDPDLPGYDSNAPTIEAPDTPPPTGGTSSGTGSGTGSGANNNGNGAGTYGSNYSSLGVTPGTNSGNPWGGDCLRYKTASPGSVVEQQLNRALGSRFAQSELGAALGNSISNIVNALTNLMIDKGLKALSSAIQGSGVNANQNGVSWSYDGLSLSGPVGPNGQNGSTNGSTTNPTDIWTIPDNNVDLYELLVTGPVTATALQTDSNGVVTIVATQWGPTLGAIADEELATYQEAKNLLQTLPTKLLDLDQCLPGPDYKWQTRLSTAFTQVSAQLSQLQNSAGGPSSYGVWLSDYLYNVQQGLTSLINTKVNSYNIPGYAVMSSQLSQANNLEEKGLEYDEKIADLTAVVNQLHSLHDQVQTIGPAQDLTPEETTALNNLIAQYASIEPNIPSQASLAVAKGERDQAQANIDAVTAYLDTGNANSCPSQKALPANEHHFSFVVTPKGVRIGTVITGTLSSAAQASLAAGTGIPNLVSGETVHVDTTVSQAPSYHVSRAPSTTTVVNLASGQQSQQLISELSNSPYSAGAANVARLNTLSQSDLELVYSAIKGNATHQYFPGVSDGQALVTLALDWLLAEQGATPITVDMNTEPMFYCQQTLDSRDLQNLLRSWNINISCNDIYNSTINDYL
jgi:hypothetical protein